MSTISVETLASEQNIEQLQSRIVAVTLTAATTLSLPVPNTQGDRLRLYVTQDGTGSRVATWASDSGSVTWIGGTAPVLSTAANAVDRFDFESIDGVNWVGSANIAGSGTIAAVLTPTLVSGTALQDTTGQWSTYYVSITGGSGGTFACAIGPTSGVADAIMPTEDAVTTHSHSIRVPPSWFVKVTVGGSAAIAGTKQVTG